MIALPGAGLALVAYWAVMRFTARRATPEISRRGADRDLLIGAGIGAAFLLVSVTLITAFGGYRFTVHGAAGIGALPGLVSVAIAGALTEELLFRGLVFQAVEQLRGPRTALAVTALLFGLAHLANPARIVTGSRSGARAGEGSTSRPLAMPSPMRRETTDSVSAAAERVPSGSARGLSVNMRAVRFGLRHAKPT